MHLDDAAIVALFFRRDEDAIRHTSEKYGPSCSTVARRILWDPLDVEECISDTWIHTWNAIPPKRPQLLGAFVARITRNLALDRYDYNTAGKRDTALTDAFDELSAALPPEEDRITAELIFREFLNDFLRSLSHTARRYFLLRYWYGLSIREIAQEDGVSETKVMSALFRTRRRLCEKMQKEGVVQ